jgi:hypothetical protein
VSTTTDQHNQIDPKHLAGVKRIPESEAFSKELAKLKKEQRHKQSGGNGSLHEESAPKNQFIHGEPVSANSVIRRTTEHSRSWEGKPVPPDTPPYELKSEPMWWTCSTIEIDIKSSLVLPENDVTLARIFDAPRNELFQRLAFAMEWCWTTLNVDNDLQNRLTYEQAHKKRWCRSRTAEALKKRFARFGYVKPYITQAAYFRLEKKEAQQHDTDIEQQREQARRRQAKRRKDMPDNVHDQIKQQRREQYKKHILSAERDTKRPDSAPTELPLA